MMRNLRASLVVGGLLRFALSAGAGTAGAPAATPDSVPAPFSDSLSVPDSALVFRVEIGNRMFPDWKEEQRVRLGEPFHIGDSETWAIAPWFVADFRISDDNRVLSASSAWNNPAVRILLYEDSTAVDSTWAFRDFPPHYSRRSFFSFKLLEILLPPPETESR